MSDKGTIGVIYKNIEKLSFIDYDSIPNVLGLDVLDFILHINNENGWDKLKENIFKLKKFENFDLIEKYKKYAKIDARKIDLLDPYILFSDIQGVDWLYEVYNGELEDYVFDNEFIKDSLYCQYGYIINLDTMKLEFYIGFQEIPQIDNRFGQIKKMDYYPCRLVSIFDIKGINNIETVYNILRKMRKLSKNKKDDPSVLKYFRNNKIDIILQKKLN